MAPKQESIKSRNPAPTAEGANGEAAPAETEKPPPTFEQMWFDDPVEGREAQKLALEIRKNVVLRAETDRIYLERTGMVAMLLQGLQHLAKARPSDPAEYLAAFLLKNNPRRDMIIVDPKAPPPRESVRAADAAPPAPPPPDDKKKPSAGSKKK